MKAVGVKISATINAPMGFTDWSQQEKMAFINAHRDNAIIVKLNEVSVVFDE